MLWPTIAQRSSTFIRRRTSATANSASRACVSRSTRLTPSLSRECVVPTWGIAATTNPWLAKYSHKTELACWPDSFKPDRYTMSGNGPRAFGAFRCAAARRVEKYFKPLARHGGGQSSKIPPHQSFVVRCVGARRLNDDVASIRCGTRRFPHARRIPEAYANRPSADLLVPLPCARCVGREHDPESDSMRPGSQVAPERARHGARVRRANDDDDDR